MLGQGGKMVKATRRPGEPLRVVFFTASYFVLDGVTLTLRKLLAYLKSIGAEVMVVTAAPLAAAGCAELGELDGENLVLVPGMPVPVENEVARPFCSLQSPALPLGSVSTPTWNTRTSAASRSRLHRSPCACVCLCAAIPFSTGKEYGYALGLGLTAAAKARLLEFRPHVAHFTVCDILGLDGIKWAKAVRWGTGSEEQQL
jgi:hypothetical protein